MNDDAKTKAELVAELQTLRAENAVLKQQLSSQQNSDSAPSDLSVQQEELLTGFFSAATQSNVGLFIADADFRYLHINQTLADINGYSIDFHLGRSVAELLPDLAPTVTPLLETLIQLGQSISNLEVSGTTPSQPGVLRHWLTSYFPIRDQHDRIIAVGGIVLEITQYKQTIEILRQKEADLRTAQRIAHVGSWHWDRSTQTSFWSEETYRIHGWDLSQPPPQDADLERLIHPEDRSLYQELTERASAGYSFEADLRIIRPDGELRSIEARVEPGIFNGQGELVRLFGTVLDVTERKQVEEALRRSEAALREAQRLAHVGSWSWTAEAGVVWSEEIYRIHGVDPACPPPSSAELTKYIHPDDLETHQAIYQATVMGKPYEFDLRIIRPDGEIRYVEARGEPGVFNEQGYPIGLFGTVHDVTDRKRVEEKLRQSEAEIRAILAAVPDMLIRVKKDGTRLFISAGSLKSYKPLGQLIGSSVYDTLPPKTAAQRMIYVQRAIETGNRQVYEYEIDIDGETRYEEARIVAINEDEALIVVRDVTERHRIEQIKTEFISVVSHELRTPLTSIQVALSLLDEGHVNPSSEDGQTMIHVATEGVDRLVRLVNDILDLERLESGRIRIKKQSCDAADLIHTAIDQMKDLANRSRILLEVTAPPYAIQADPDRIVQVLTNLLSNAIRFSPACSAIELSAEPIAREKDSFLCFRVVDQGRGIPADQLERIFERFQQVDASDSREKGGTGLGLAICRSIVQQHGGQIWAESCLGKGSTFYFTLPVLENIVDGNETHFTD
ncbi:PAS domain-containing protein [Leptolyngbya ohadii]|uniref:PAS domain-containing protein n=1 Tax=Leptolyngbya ohadii TaxID=1962290 RepID=UPI000B5A0585|nr:PAS domain-containing protein [Leptolyngbya ohadii]